MAGETALPRGSDRTADSLHAPNPADPPTTVADVLRSHRQALRGLAERLSRCESAQDDALDATAGELARLGERLDRLEERLAALDGGQDLAGLLAG